MKTYEARVMGALMMENHKLQQQVLMLRSTLEPFARKADAISLREALGHIDRNDLILAREAMQQTEK